MTSWRALFEEEETVRARRLCSGEGSASVPTLVEGMGGVVQVHQLNSHMLWHLTAYNI